ncbi:MAG: hypothetical protein AABW67_02615 [Nanoarchaeota archaeon]
MGDLDVYKEARNWNREDTRKIQTAIFSGSDENLVREEANDFMGYLDMENLYMEDLYGEDIGIETFIILNVEVTTKKDDKGNKFIQIKIVYGV